MIQEREKQLLSGGNAGMVQWYTITAWVLRSNVVFVFMVIVVGSLIALTRRWYLYRPILVFGICQSFRRLP